MRVTLDARADRSEIDGAETTRLIDELCARGFSRAELARRLGYKTWRGPDGRTKGPRLQFYGQKRVYAKTALRIKKLHARLMPKACGIDPVERVVELAGMVA
jgi:hypothetical protein